MGEKKGEDCLPCRLTNGLGCLFIGLVLLYQGNKNTSGVYARYFTTSLAIGFAGIGTARLFNLPPFKSINKETE